MNHFMISLIKIVSKYRRALFQALGLFILTSPGRMRLFRKAQIVRHYILYLTGKLISISDQSLEACSRRRQIEEMLTIQLESSRSLASKREISHEDTP